MKNIKLVVFDFDGTLCDSKGIIVKTLQMTLEQLGYEARSDADCAATIGLPLTQCFIELVPNLSKKDADVCAKTYREFFEKNKLIQFPDLFPHVKEVIAQLFESGVQMAIATSRAHKSMATFCDKYDLTKYMKVLIGSDDITNPKPAPDSVIYIMNSLNISPENTLVVGDMTYDILMGSRSGAYTCGVTYGNGTFEELSAVGANFIIDDFSQLLSIVE